MGNICGKSSSDPGEQPVQGRVTAAPAQSTKPTSTVPRKVGGPGRTVGGNAGESTSDPAEARRKAAEAAEVYL